MRSVLLQFLVAAALAGCASSATSMPEPDGAWMPVNTAGFLAEGPDPAPAPRPLPPRVRRWRPH
jgi:uncharacterized protein YceK